MNADVKEQFEKRWERMRAARDQLRLEVNLARLEAKKRWKELGSRVQDVQKLAADVTQVSRRALSEIAQKVSEFRSAPRRPGGGEPPTAMP
jgi:SMC interacting uncharacterized protein involved in chromosome segregation